MAKKPTTDGQKKPSSRKKANASVKKDISAAVNTLPDLIAKEVYVSADTPNQPRPSVTPKRKPGVPIPAPQDTGKRRIMWTGVALTVAVVFTMWVWNARAGLYDISVQKSQEARLFDEAKNDLDQIFETISLDTAAAETPKDGPVPETPTPSLSEEDIRSALETLVADNPQPEPEQSVLGVTITSHPTTTPVFPTSGVRTTAENTENFEN